MSRLCSALARLGYSTRPVEPRLQFMPYSMFAVKRVNSQERAVFPTKRYRQHLGFLRMLESQAIAQEIEGMGLGDLVQKAVYLGVGLASYAGEKAGEKLAELRVQAQKLADEMVERGEMTTEEARKFVDDMVTKAQQPSVVEQPKSSSPSQPRQIEILDDESAPSQSPSNEVDEMRRRVAELQEELRRLKNN